MTEHLPDEFKQYFTARTPMNRAAESGEVAKFVLFLCSDGASYMNGAIVPVDGGMLCR